MTSIRLSKKQENDLQKIAEAEQVSKSDIIKEALDLYIKRFHNATSPYELGKDVFGKYGSGRNDNSTTYKSKLKKKINAKISH